MSAAKDSIARACLEGAETGSMTFPAIVQTLMQAGFEGYAIDFRAATATYYLYEDDPFVLPLRQAGGPVAASFDASVICSAIRDAQQLAPGYSYRGFCQQVTQAGCAGYMVSFSGRRALYHGRTAETHVEHFPD